MLQREEVGEARARLRALTTAVLTWVGLLLSLSELGYLGGGKIVTNLSYMGLLRGSVPTPGVGCPLSSRMSLAGILWTL